jgi:class 3 adenylate cyclase
MTTTFDAGALTMTEIIRLQTLLSQELTRRFERSAALAFTDIVDSTRYFAQFGDEAGRRLQQLHLDLLEQCLASSSSDGRIVDTAGDGAFVSFATSMAAAQAMVALQARISGENLSRPRAHQLSLRIGMHWGQVLTDGVQVTGEAVNLCARLCATAQPSQIRLSREMFQQLDPDQRQQCWPLGNVPVKGITRTVELMELRWRDRSLFPSQLLIHESGECIALPQLDILCFGRGEMQQGSSAHDVILTLPDAAANKQISRRHFELHSRQHGYVLKALSTQFTEVDGVVLQRDQEQALRPGSVVRLARVMTLEFVSPDEEAAIDETKHSRVLSPLAFGATIHGLP